MNSLKPPLIENHDENTSRYPVRKFIYRLVDVDHQSGKTYGKFPYPSSPGLKEDGFYHVSVYNLSESWWRVPTAAEQTLLKARYGDGLIF